MTTDMSAAAAGFREFKMPDVGEGLTEAEILKWYVAPGDTVTDGQVVCEVETAKAAVELPIPYDGVVRELRFEEGATVDVGVPIIAVDVSGGAAPQEAAPAPAGDEVAPASAANGAGSAAPVANGAGSAAPVANGHGSAAPPARTPVLVGYGVSESSTKRRPRRGAGVVPQSTPAGAEAGAQAAAPAPATSAPAAPVPAAPAPAAESRAGERPLAKPPVRKLAKDLGVDLATIVATGPDGIVTREDVHAAVAVAAAPAPQGAAPAAEPVSGTPTGQVPGFPGAGAGAGAGAGVSAGPGGAGVGAVAGSAAGEQAEAAVAAGARETRTPIKGVRKATAAAMVGSAFTAPHVTEFVTVDVTRTVKLVEELKSDPDMAGLRVNPLLLIARALLVAIRRNPGINAAWDEANQEIVQKHYVNLGIAAATPRGLIVPNIKEAHAKTLPQLAESLADLVATAREGRTSPGAMQGGTVTITNVGVFGIDSGTPILNPGEAAILAVGAIKLQPWVHKGKVKPRRVTTLALSFDHRLVDGELGSKVLADVAAILEQPKRLITWV